MLYPISILSIILLALIHLTHAHSEHIHPQHDSHPSTLPSETRAYWMRKAISALAELESPCHFQAFGTAIVNHTDTSSDPKGRLVCIGVNSNVKTGNPTMHGEMAAINNCSIVMTDPNGRYKLTPSELMDAWKDLSLYTTAEACPMCASAIRWSGFAEYIYATSMDTLFETGWNQINIRSADVFEESGTLPRKTSLLGGVLANETDPLFSWQFDESYPCPKGCARTGEGKICVELKSYGKEEL